MANSGQLKACWSSSYPTAAWQFDWTSTPDTKKPGITNVTWTLKTVGRSSSPTQLYSWCDFSIKNNNNGDTVDSYSREESQTSFTGNLRDSGSFSINHTSDGKASFTVSMEGRIFNYDIESSSKTFELDINYPHTNIYWGPTANVDIANPYISPTGKLVIEWSSANPGTGVSINKYLVEYKIGEGNWVQNEVNSDLNVYEVSLNCEESRGLPVYARVKAISNPEGYDSPYLQSGASYINIKPASPVIQGYSGKNTSNIVPTETEEFNIFYSQEGKTGQTVDTCFVLGEGESTQKGSNGKVILKWPDEGNEITVSCYADDGVEQSDIQVITLKRNDSQLKNTRFEYANYLISVSQPESESIASSIYGYSGTLLWSSQLSNGSKKTSGSFNMEGSTAVDIRRFIDQIESGQVYYLDLEILFTDGVDIHTEKYPYRILLQVPALSFEGREDIGLYFDTEVTCTLSPSSKYWTPITDVKDDEVSRGQQISTIKINGGHDYSFPMKATNSITRIKTLELDLSISNESNSYKPYSQQLALSGRIDRNWNQYGLTKAPDLQFSFDEDTFSSSVSGAESINDNTVNYTLGGKDSWKIAEPVRNTEEGTLKYKYTNVFSSDNEMITVTASKKIVLDFTEPASSYENEDKCWISSNDYDLNSWDCLIQGMPLETSFQVLAFSTPSAKLQYQAQDSDVWKDWIALGTEQGANTNISHKYNTNPTLYSFFIKEPEEEELKGVPQILQDEWRKIRIVVETDSSSPLIEELNPNNQNFYLFRGHTPPLVQFTSLDYSNGTVSAAYNILNWGCSNVNDNNGYTLNPIERGTADPIEEGIESADLPSTGVFEFKFTKVSDWDYTYFAPILTTFIYSTVQGSDQPQCHKLSTLPADYEFLICYNISPTVSYRQNHIGINTNQIDSDKNSVAIISQYNQRNNLIFMGVSSNNSALKASLNLSTMGFDGFVIDGGTWDGTSGGIVTENPAAGLAKIAYTGEIGDIQQTKDEPIIVIAGGGAVEYITDEEI